MEEKYFRTGFELAKAQIFRELTLAELFRLSESDVKKKIGRMAQEANLSREEVLEFVQSIMSEIVTRTKEISDMIHSITFK